MLDQMINNYLQALRQRENIRKKFRELSEIISEAARQSVELLKNATPGNHQAHYMFNLGRFELAPTGKWPTSEAVNKAAQELLTALSQVEESWNRIPKDHRIGLSPPNAT